MFSIIPKKQSVKILLCFVTLKKPYNPLLFKLLHYVFLKIILRYMNTIIQSTHRHHTPVNAHRQDQHQ